MEFKNLDHVPRTQDAIEKRYVSIAEYSCSIHPVDMEIIAAVEINIGT